MLKLRTIFVFFLVGLLLISGCAASPHSETSKNEILESSETAQFHFIDVGQGDCTLIYSDDTVILIDAGTYESGSNTCNYIKNLGIDTIDYFIGSHPHEDHIGGAAAVLTLFDVENVFMNGEFTTSYAFEKMVDVMLRKNITPVIPEINKSYDAGPFKLKFISPENDYKDTNNNSLVLSITYKDIKALFTGDCERMVESYLVNSDKKLSADILKVAHHGSRDSSSSDFLEKVSPTVAVIQCGKDNSYGHPHKETLERLSRTNAQIFRTDESGTIILRTDGIKIYNTSGEEQNKSQQVEKETDYIGNINSRVFHRKTCKNLPSEKNRIGFATIEEAIENNYKACGNCNP